MSDYERALIRQMNRLFNAGRLDALVELFAPVLPIYTNNGISLSATHADTKKSLLRLMEAARDLGSVLLEHEIKSVQVSPKSTSSVVFVAWNYLGADGHAVASGEVKYYCGRDPLGIARILMVEYVTPAFTEALSEVPRSKNSRVLN